MAGETSAASEDMGFRRVEASRWLSFAARFQPAVVHVVFRTADYKGWRLSGQSLLLLLVKLGHRRKFHTQPPKVNITWLNLTNFSIKTTIGIPILVVFLNLLTHGFSLTPLGNPPESIQSGNYGRPPKTKWWLKQSFIYFLGLLGMKACVFFIFQICPWIIRVGDWALRWTEGNEMVQVFFVMLFFPVVMNALQYYIIDSFIKNQKPSDHDPIPGEDGDDSSIDESGRTRRWYSRGEESNRANDGDAGHATSKDGAEIKVSEGKDKPKLRVEATKLDEYDPAIDGEGSGNSGEPDNPPDPSQGPIARSQRNHAKDS